MAADEKGRANFLAALPDRLRDCSAGRAGNASEIYAVANRSGTDESAIVFSNDDGCGARSYALYFRRPVAGARALAFRRRSAWMLNVKKCSLSVRREGDLQDIATR